MLFNSYSFVLFFLAVLGVTRALPARHRSSFLLGASLLFYFSWIPAYLILLLVAIGVNYGLVRLLGHQQHRRWVLAASVIFPLGLLAYYKYAAFLVSAALSLAPTSIETGSGLPSILLPLGISFYTFQIVALNVDVYRGTIDPIKSLREYALFVCFFPQLIAGPILRGSQLLPQIHSGGEPTAERTRRGLWLITAGLGKKVLLADVLLAPFVDRVFAAPGFATAPEHLLAVYSFAFQIYFDFSGYTDIARGLALLLGFELPLNFKEPYLSRNPAEFWRRWHITLSQWLRDYLYIPLGGNRGSGTRTQLNLLLTMLLGGLWHGAAWNFVIWGGLHGLLLAVHRALPNARVSESEAVGVRDGPAILAFFHAVCLLWIFFRAATFGDAMAVLGALATLDYAVAWPAMQCLVIAFCLAFHCVERLARVHVASLRERLGGVFGGLAEATVMGCVVGLVIAFGGSGGEFIYFQF